jgi:uncharacterized repeat protein (TIGR01451 family)
VNVANITDVNENNTGNNSTDGNNSTIEVPEATVNLSITKTANTTTAKVGDLVLYTITVTNHGPDNATGVVVTDVLDSRLVFVNATGGNYNVTGNTVVWNIGNLTVGSTVTLNITVRINGTGNIVNVANITDVNENNTGNNSTDGNNSTIDRKSAVYGNGVLKKMLDLRAMESHRIHAAICLKHPNKRNDLGDLVVYGE